MFFCFSYLKQFFLKGKTFYKEMKRKSNKGESPTRVFDKLRIQYCEEGEKSLEIDLPQLIVDFDQFYQVKGLII